jgi:acetyl esterase/lipase
MSWQATFINHLIRFLLPHGSDHVDILKRRQRLEALSRYAIIPPYIRSIPIRIGNLSAEWLKTANTPDAFVFIYLHGGGYVLCSVSTHRDLITRLVKASGIQALGINYRLAPEHPFPAALEDATQAYRWLLAEGFDPQKIVIGGDSAGGGLTIATLIKLRDSGDPLPAGGVCLSPWMDLAITGDTIRTRAKNDPILNKDEVTMMAKPYVGDNDPTLPLISPVYAELHDLPPLLIQVGSDEILLDDSIRLANKARESGVDVTFEIWEGMVHVFQAFAVLLPEGRKAIDKIGKFVQLRVGL